MMKKYDKDIETIDIKLQILKKKLEDETETGMELAQRVSCLDKFTSTSLPLCYFKDKETMR